VKCVEKSKNAVKYRKRMCKRKGRTCLGKCEVRGEIKKRSKISEEDDKRKGMFRR